MATSEVYLSDEGAALVRDLLDKYPKYIRPVKKESTPVVVTHRLTPIQMIDMDEKNQIIMIKCWLSQRWTDEYLSWDASLYNDITQIQVPIVEIWQPDITLFGSVSDEFQRHYDTDAIIDSDGTVTSLQPFVIRCTCGIDATYFPFDEQECKLKFASWSYDIKFLDMLADNKSDTDRFVPNGEWELVGMPIIRSEEKYVCCDDPFPDITYIIHLKRRSLFYIFNIIFPSFLACVLVAVGFYLPSDSGERITLCVTSILSQFVFLTVVGEFMPPNSEYIPHLQRYFFVSIGLVVVSAVVTASSLSMHFKGPGCEEAPRWLKQFAFRFLARITCTEVRLKGRFTSSYLRSTRSARRNSITRNSMATYSGGEDIPLEQQNNICMDQEKSGPETPIDCETRLMSKPTVMNNRGNVHYRVERHVDNLDIEVYEKRLREWREVARIMDRSFFIFYIALLVLLVTGFLSSIAISASNKHRLAAQESH
uniref:Neuronal acetylcholine receptor subunit alpha-10-like n=1 Tax=Saccoglossus kowalevskii TaxID=10224 RepID=A0ABM0MXN8_SACKO|nr:PREDICTED: neuronal acetylcholine receptor subunit alpha-10-like [Saccoglossus kowalevskii]